MAEVKHLGLWFSDFIAQKIYQFQKNAYIQIKRKNIQKKCT